MLNRATLVGNVGKDPEIRTTQAGAKVASFSLATSETWRDRNSGEREERTEWHNIVCWSEGLCKVIEQYVRKGSKLYVEGKIQTRKWQDRDGNDRYSTEIVLQGFDAKLLMLNKVEGGREQSSRDDRDYGGGYGSGSSGASSGGSTGAADLDDEIPF